MRSLFLSTTEVLCVNGRQPFLESGLRLGMGRAGGEVLPLVRDQGQLSIGTPDFFVLFRVAGPGEPFFQAAWGCCILVGLGLKLSLLAKRGQ